LAGIKVEAFFQTIDSLKIAENHAQEAAKLERQQAVKLLKRYSEIRQTLRDRLDTMQGDTFTAQQLRGVIIQVESAIFAMIKSLKTEMAQSGQILTQKGLDDLIKETQRFEQTFMGAVTPLNINVAVIATDVNNFKINQYDSSLNAYGQDLVSEISLQLSNAVLQQESLSKVLMRLNQYFLGEEWKLLRIARTELHSSYAMGKWEGMKTIAETSIPKLKKALYHPMDNRTAEDSKYIAVKNPILPINEPFTYTWAGKKRIFMFPPDRPNDRSILIPAHDAWVKSAKSQQKTKSQA